MDAQRLQENFQTVAAHGTDVAEFFYSDLFRRNPEYRSLFPASMSRQHEVLLQALSRIVSLGDNPTELVPYVQELGRAHRDFGVTASHYPEVGVSLISTLRYFSGVSWNTALEKDWAEAYDLVAGVMVDAAAEKT